ncbi:TetR/AcrR family transcriptional regulator [Planctomonas psychrotolerans]|uniref:TetR/AcrR family transcriptional regulator n=1 Tax=Planctomonas psychrotolerans TaxID=2528712 RepID=UPI001D0CEAA3|nr:TetR/AcrR family transcriptional regulator [Planctomonas psychrotolerans]
MAEQPRRGRPVASSRSTLEDAAAELFLERTYAGTSVSDITQRAGVSRSTFFNYFSSKSDVLWVTYDESIGRVAARLAAIPPDVPAMTAVRRAFAEATGPIESDRVPWAVTQRELMGTTEELQASGLARFMEQAAVLRRFLAGRTGMPTEDVGVQAAAFAVLGAVAAAAGAWAGAGVTRAPLHTYVDSALAPVCDGFAPVFLSS